MLIIQHKAKHKHVKLDSKITKCGEYSIECRYLRMSLNLYDYQFEETRYRYGLA